MTAADYAIIVSAVSTAVLSVISAVTAAVISIQNAIKLNASALKQDGMDAKLDVIHEEGNSHLSDVKRQLAQSIAAHDKTTAKFEEALAEIKRLKPPLGPRLPPHD